MYRKKIRKNNSLKKILNLTNFKIRYNTLIGGVAYENA
jgi:hypothetical protein